MLKGHSRIIFLTGISLLILSGCTYNCTCDEPEYTKISAQPIPKDEQLLNECAYIKSGIADSKSLAKKMADSRYAVYYQAMSRERISTLQKREKEISCPP